MANKHTFVGPQLGKYGPQLNAAAQFYWVPDPIVIAERVMRIRDDLEDRTIPLAVSKGIVGRDIEQNFEGEHDPEGNPWAPWSSAYHPKGHPEAGQRKMGYYDPAKDRSYVEKKGYAENLPPGHSGKILNWRGILKEAATSESSFLQVSGRSVNDDSLFFDTSELPLYWDYHQYGTVNVPERRFLGLSGEAEILILEEFEKWFIDTLENAVVHETFTSSRGRTFARKRYPKGTPGGLGGRFVRG
jgi:hypothetical protein